MLVYSSGIDQPTGEVAEQLVHLLRPYLPTSLPIITHLTTPPRPPFLRIYLSSDVEELKTRRSKPFCVATASVDGPSSTLVRFYCSAEHEESHKADERASAEVKRFAETWLPCLFRDLNSDTQILIGTLHSRWTEIYKAWSVYNGPCIKFLRAASPVKAVELGAGVRLVPLSDADIDRVIATTHIPRPRTYLEARRPYSVALRVEDTLAAWGIVHSDGSIGTLFTEPEFRRRGYGQIVMNALVSLALGLTADVGGSPEAEAVGQGATMGWCAVDVMKSNPDGLGLFSKLSGWTQGWDCAWVAIARSKLPSSQQIQGQNAS